MNEEDKNIFHTKTNIWTEKIEHTLREIGEFCTGYKWMNLYAAKKTLRKYNILMYSSIFIGPISGVLSAIASNYEDKAEQLQVIITIFGFLSGVVSTIIKFSKLSDKSSSYKTVSAKYASLEGNIRRQLSLSRNERVNPGEYLEWISSSFDELFNSTPLVSDNIYGEWVEYAKKNGLSIPKELGRFVLINPDENQAILKNLEKIEINQKIENFEKKDIKIDFNISENFKNHKENSKESKDDEKNDLNKTTSINKSQTNLSNRHKIYEPTDDLSQFSDSRMNYELKRLNRII